MRRGDRVSPSSLKFLAAIAFAGLWASATPAQDQTFDYRGDDAEMNEAMAKARETLPVLFENLGRPDVKAFMLKVAVDASDAGRTLEHIWMSECRSGRVRELACIVANAPHSKNIVEGELYEFDIKEITDWAYFDDAGMMHGAYTMRVILPRLPEDQAASYRAILAPLPE